MKMTGGDRGYWLVGQGELGGGRHFAEWQDPFPKPSCVRPQKRAAPTAPSAIPGQAAARLQPGF